MIKDKGYSYYNYFLFLSLFLIAGYFITSLYLMNRSSRSGKQAEMFGYTVEKTNKVIQQVTQLETSAYSFILTKGKRSKAIYLHKKEGLLKDVDKLINHCLKLELPFHETEKLNKLIIQRIKTLEYLMSEENMSSDHQIEHMAFGNETTLQILNTLKKIRSVNGQMRESNQRDAKIANRNAMVLLAIFGAIMILIVFISFFKMRKEIMRSERYLKEINQINFELSSMNENLENFAYVASHDLNEPLRKIKTFGDLIEIELSNEEISRETIVQHVNRMQSASTRMQDLIEDLLSYSRISRDYEINKKIDLNKEVLTVLSDLEISIKENNAEIIINRLPHEILADEVQMRQLFQNLISNAIKFKKADQDPIVKIDCERVIARQTGIEELQAYDNKEYWKISVNDNGIGFEEQYSEKVFAVFQRLHGRSAYEGTGIGLSICKKIAENHNGSISVISKIGEGATFEIYLPVT